MGRWHLHWVGKLGTTNASKGTKFEYKFYSPGIYQIRANITSTNGQQIFDYVRKNDDPFGADSHGTYNKLYRRGQVDYIGVARAERDAATGEGGASTAFEIVKSARGALDSKAWAEAPAYTLSNGFVVPPGASKCNIFIYEILNPLKAVPVDSAGAPPRAYEWWKVDKNINGWTWHGGSWYAEPGVEVARYQGGFLQFRLPILPGHCGILDYDGAWISAGSANVNRNPHITDKGFHYSNNGMSYNQTTLLEIHYQTATFRD